VAIVIDSFTVENIWKPNLLNLIFKHNPS